MEYLVSKIKKTTINICVRKRFLQSFKSSSRPPTRSHHQTENHSTWLVHTMNVSYCKLSQSLLCCLCGSNNCFKGQTASKCFYWVGNKVTDMLPNFLGRFTGVLTLLTLEPGQRWAHRQAMFSTVFKRFPERDILGSFSGSYFFLGCYQNRLTCFNAPKTH